MINFAGKIVQFAGDSVSYGLFSSTTSKRWTSLFCAMVGATEENHAVGGTTLEPGLPGRIAFNPDVINAKNGNYGPVFIAYGINDIESTGTPLGYKNAMASAVTSLTAKGYSPNDIIFLSTYYFISEQGVTDAQKIVFVNAVRDKSAELGTNYVDVWTADYNNPNIANYLADDYHRNDAGHQAIANVVYAALTSGSPSIVRGINIIPNQSYTLQSAVQTSLDVRDTNSKMIRSFWGGKNQLAGTYQQPFWDGRDNDGNLVADGNYQLRITTNNIAYTWHIVGNTSDSQTGPTVHHAQDVITGMCFTGNFCYYTVGYSEGGQGIEKFNINTPQQKINFLPGFGGSMLLTCTDGINVYFGGSAPAAAATSTGLDARQLIYAVKASDDSQVVFSNGTTVSDIFGSNRTFSCIDITQSTIYDSAGFADCSMGAMTAQQSGNYLFVSYFDRNEIHVVNKITGALIRTITTFTTPRAMCIDKDSDNAIWIGSGTNTVAKYTINSDGTFTAATLTLSGLVKPLSITCKAGTVAVQDGSTKQQARFFNNTTGTEGTPLGQVGGYVTSSTVANDKFMFRNTKDFSKSDANCFIAYALDGSLWVGDRGNYRVQHFSASNVFIESLMNIGYFYDSHVLKADPSQMFANYLQFNVNLTDYSWTLTHNWAYNITDEYDIQGGRLNGIYKASNNRVYALANHIYQSSGQTIYRNQFIELVEGGNVRYTGVEPSFTGQQFDVFYALNSDGSILRLSSTAIGQPAQWIRTPITYDSNNNPILGSDGVIASIGSVDANGPIVASGLGSDQITATGNIICFDNETSGGYHIGIKDPNLPGWKVLTSPSTNTTYNGPYPKNGDYDIGNSVVYQGSRMNVAATYFSKNCHGEFWKGSQIDKVDIYLDDGSFLIQSGITGPEAVRLGESPYGYSANTVSGTLRELLDGRLIHVRNDEGHHGAIPITVYTGLDTIQQQTFTIVKNGTPVAPVVSYRNLMADVPYSQSSFASTPTWTRTPAADIDNVDGESLYIKTSDQTYKKEDRDITIYSRPKVGQSRVITVVGNLGTVNSSAWKISGQFSFLGTVDSTFDSSRGYLEVIDGAGKIIFQLSAVQYNPTTDYRLILNNTTAYQATATVFFTKTTYPENIEISVSSGTVTLKYKDIIATAPLLDNTAAWQQPAIVQTRMISSTGIEHKMSILNFIVFPNG